MKKHTHEWTWRGGSMFKCRVCGKLVMSIPKAGKRIDWKISHK